VFFVLGALIVTTVIMDIVGGIAGVVLVKRWFS